MQLLGRHVVIWNDGAVDNAPVDVNKISLPFFGKKKPLRAVGTWRCFEDKCPHRNAPLSEGRIEDTGELLCAYHAWRFNGDGACTKIPQAQPTIEAKLCSNPRASCNSFPIMEADGLLWVWPESGPNATLEAFTLRSPALVPELHDPSLAGRVKQLPWNVRELPYGWDMFMENVQDPSHVPVSHHGIVGNR